MIFKSFLLSSLSLSMRIINSVVGWGVILNLRLFGDPRSTKLNLSHKYELEITKRKKDTKISVR
jgi:hypothetical protein